MVILLKIKRRDLFPARPHSYFGHALWKLGSSNCCIFEMKHATGMEICTKIYFLFIFNLEAILTLQFDDVTVKTIYNNHTEGTKVACPLVLPPPSACFGLFWSVRRGIWVRDCLGIHKKTTTTTTTESLPENDSKYSSALTLESWSTFVGAPRHETTEPAYFVERTLWARSIQPKFREISV